MGPRIVIFGVALGLCLAIALLITLIEEPADTAAEVVNDSPAQWALPEYLREASGLAILDANHLLVHNDEKGNLYRVSLDTKSIEKWVSIGIPPIDQDFEGIAIDHRADKTADTNENLTTYLLTSTGMLFVVRDMAIDTPRQQLSAVALDTGLKSVCEIEGLHLHDGELLAPCKTALTAKHKNKLVVFSINPETGERKTHFSIPEDRLENAGKLRPTAIATLGSRYYIISTNRLIVFDEATDSIELFKLPKKVHFQPEGIAVLADGSIYIVDDNRRGISRLTFYQDLSELTALTN